MRLFRWLVAVVLLVLCAATVLIAQTPPYRRDDVFQFVNGFVVGETGSYLSGMTRPSAGVVQVGGTDVTSLTALAGTSVVTQDSNGRRQTAVATQTIGAGGIIAADSCGGVKNITAAGAVTTDTVNSITAPAAANTGCLMLVCNVGAQTVTIDKNANILLVGGVDVALLANSCVTVFSNGTIWRQATAQLTAT